MDAAGDDSPDFDDFVAVVGMAGRFPQSPDLATFWDNLRHGRDCLRTFSDADDRGADLGEPTRELLLVVGKTRLQKDHVHDTVVLDDRGSLLRA